MDLTDVLMEIEDHLMPRLDVYQKAIYYHLFRHTRAMGEEMGTFAPRPIAQAIGISESAARERIRMMQDKGFIEIRDRNRSGHVLRVKLPSEIPGLLATPTAQPEPNITTLDFYTGRHHVSALLAREGGRCFWCLREITAKTCALDHVIPQHSETDHSFKNVVAVCHGCNSDKHGLEATAFLRSRYRKGLLSNEELEERLTMLRKLQAGELVPVI